MSTMRIRLGLFSYHMSILYFREHLQDLEDMIRQAGLQIHDCRRYTVEQTCGTDHVVDVIANYEDLTLEQWGDLIEQIR